MTAIEQGSRQKTMIYLVMYDAGRWEDNEIGVVAAFYDRVLAQNYANELAKEGGYLKESVRKQCWYVSTAWIEGEPPKTN